MNDYLQSLPNNIMCSKCCLEERCHSIRALRAVVCTRRSICWQGNADDQRLAISQAVDHVVDDMVSRAAVFQERICRVC